MIGRWPLPIYPDPNGSHTKSNHMEIRAHNLAEYVYVSTFDKIVHILNTLIIHSTRRQVHPSKISFSSIIGGARSTEHIESRTIPLQLVALINNRYPGKSSNLLHVRNWVFAFIVELTCFHPRQTGPPVICSTERETEREREANRN